MEAPPEEQARLDPRASREAVARPVAVRPQALEAPDVAAAVQAGAEALREPEAWARREASRERVALPVPRPRATR